MAAGIAVSVSIANQTIPASSAVLPANLERVISLPLYLAAAGIEI
jgi:hypothetical protein